MLKPIKTKYNGFKFRSRTEARWAVFFDHLGIAYQYEVEGFKEVKDFKGEVIRYLPDFYLPEYSMWLEIKRSGYDWQNNKKIINFANQTDHRFFVVTGAPQKDQYAAYMLANHEIDDVQFEHFKGVKGFFTLARRADKPELCFSIDNEDMQYACMLIDNPTDDGKRWPLVKPELEAAYKKAITYRFRIMAPKKFKDFNQAMCAEMFLLGTLILGKASYATKRLKTDNFSKSEHKMIFNAIAALKITGKDIDFATVADELDRTGNLGHCGGIEYIATILGVTFGFEHGFDYCAALT